MSWVEKNRKINNRRRGGDGGGWDDYSGLESKSIIRKKKKKHNKRVLLAKSKLNCIEVLISQVLINSNIGHDEFILINNVLKKYGLYERKKSKVVKT